MGTPLQPKLPNNYAAQIYIPLFTLDGGMVWQALKIETSLSEAKRKLRSVIPDKWHIENEYKDKFRCGLFIYDLKLLDNESARIFIELSATDFSAGV